MPSNRVVTSLAIAFGGVLGSVAAIVAQPPEPAPPATALPFQPVSRGAGASVEVNVPSGPLIPPPPTVPATATPRREAAPPPPAALPAPTDDTIKQTELDCARGNGRACLDAAEAYRHGRGMEEDPERARMLTGLGVQKFAISCMERIPAGCLELAKLHNTGRGVAQDQKAADALVDRAAMLCRSKPELPGCPGERE